MRKLTMVFLCLFAGISLVTAQSVMVKGLVLSADDGQPIIGASVVAKGAAIGTATDMDGKFNLSVPQSAKSLVVSYVGMKTKEVPVAANVKVVLETNSKALNEVVVTAMGITRSQKSLSYATAQVGSEEITKGGDRSALSALQGKVAGVNISQSSGAPGASTRIVLRGYTTLNGVNQPLFVIDGVSISNSSLTNTSLSGSVDYGNKVNDINPNDIESISILKGASASAQYGSRAQNGVVLITTKKGSAVDKLKVEISNSTTFSNPLRLPQMQNEFGQGWSANHDLLENGSWGPKFDGVDRIWGHFLTDDGEQLYKPYVGLKNNVRDFLETGTQINNNISISGGRDKTTFYLAYSNSYEDGILPTDVDNYKRNAVTLRGDTKNDFLSVSSSINYINKQVSAMQGGQGLSVYNNLSQIPRDISIVDMKDYKNKFYNLDNYFTPYGVVNPYYTLAEDGNNMNEDRVFGNIQIDLTFNPWLKAIARVGNDYAANHTKSWRSIVKASGYNEGKNDEPGSVDLQQGYMNEFNTDIFMLINPTFGDFSLNSTIGYNLNMRLSKSTAQSVLGLDLPNYYDLSNSSSQPVVDEYLSSRRLIGVYASADLGYKNFVYLNLSARNDWSSTLPATGRSFFYPTAGVSFLFPEAIPALKDIFSYGKLRATYGRTGNDAFPYSLKSVFVKADIPYSFGGLSFPLAGNNAYEVANTIGNPNLTPEFSYEFEVGGDIRFFDNRLGIDATYYNKITKNQILQVPLAHSSGYQYQWMNLGDVRNRGIEVTVSMVPVKTKDLEWDLNLTFTRNRNMVLKLPELLQSVSLGGTTALSYKASVGMPMGYYEGVVAERTADGKVVVDAKGIPLQSSVKQTLGTSEADYTFGVNSKIAWKGLSLSAQIDIRKGGVIYSRTADINYFVGNAPQTTFNDRQPFIVPNSVRKYTEADGKEAYIENTTPISMANMCTYWDKGGVDFDRSWLLSKTNVRLREVVLSYKIPNKFFAGTFISGLDLSLIGRNLLLWTPDSNRFIDPDVTTFGNNVGGDYGEFSTSPSVRNLGFSVKLSL